MKLDTELCTKCRYFSFGKKIPISIFDGHIGSAKLATICPFLFYGEIDLSNPIFKLDGIDLPNEFVMYFHNNNLSFYRHFARQPFYKVDNIKLVDVLPLVTVEKHKCLFEFEHSILSN